MEVEGAHVDVGKFDTLLWRRDERAFLTRFEQCRGLDRGRGRLQKPMVCKQCGCKRRGSFEREGTSKTSAWMLVDARRVSAWAGWI